MTSRRRQLGPVMAAAIEGDFEEVKRLLSLGLKADVVDGYKQTPLFYAVKHNNIDGADLLIQAGNCVHHTQVDGAIPLHGCAFLGHVALACVLIDKYGADVNARRLDGKTPLHRAVEGGYPEMVAALVQRGAHVGECDNDGRTALDLAKQLHSGSALTAFSSSLVSPAEELER